MQSGLRTTEINNLMPKNSSKLWIQVNDQLQIYDFENNQYILCHFYLFIYYQIKQVYWHILDLQMLVSSIQQSECVIYIYIYIYISTVFIL